MAGVAISAYAYRQNDILLDSAWKFSRGEIANAKDAGFDDSKWQEVSVPHDWAINGPFDMNHDKQFTAVVQDGETTARTRTGRTGALPFEGVGWYRKDISLPESESGKRVFVQFDGAMSNAQVWLNGEYVGEWPFGYASFELELTKYFKFGKKNALAVRLENLPAASRWYAGAGIFRDVRLAIKPQTHIVNWGTYIITPKISENSALCRIETTFDSTKNENAELITKIYSPDGKLAGEQKAPIVLKDGKAVVSQDIEVKSPKLWSIETPQLYKAESIVCVGGKEIDRYFTDFGIRSIKFTRDGGFELNGKKVYIKGVCMHHDLGPIGIAFNVSAARRQLEILKDMGCNALRTSHNPPSPALLKLCDEMGILVQCEAFDEWKKGKCENGYNRLFEKWAEKDLVAMIKRDRNHPCVFMWSVGNEINEQSQPEGWKVAKFLVDICHRADPTRPVTAGIDRYNHAMKHNFVEQLDLVGFNYKPHLYAEAYKLKPNAIIYGSETASTVSSRGVYHFPVKERKHPFSFDYHVSSYDWDHAPWSQTPEQEWDGQDKNPFVFGEFVWTGFDYLGEPFPYDGNFIARSSYFGIVDLAGLKKDRFYLYRVRWNPDAPTLHILPHWTFPERVGQKTPVYCYTNNPKAELFVNGKSQGMREKDPSDKLKKHRLMWDDVVYEAGEIKVVAYSADGKVVAEKTVKTAGDPAKIELSAPKKTYSIGGKELCFVEVSVLDKDGNLCPRANNILYFSTDGNVSLKALCNGDPTDLTSFGSSYMRAFSGKLVAVLESNGKAGSGELEAFSGAIKSATIKVEYK